MESLIKPGQFVEIGSDEWKAHIILEKVRIQEAIQKLQEEKETLQRYIWALEGGAITK